MAIEAHRSAKPHNMGTLYWQINDCWPVASWLGMDYYQRWKAMHYFVKKAFAPVAVSAREVDNEVEIRVVSDRMDSLEATLDLRILDFDGNPVWNRQFQILAAPNTAFLAAAIPSGELHRGQSGRNQVMEMTLKQGENVLHRNLVYFHPVKDLHLPEDPGLQMEVIPNPSGTDALIPPQSGPPGQNTSTSPKPKGSFPITTSTSCPAKPSRSALPPNNRLPSLPNR